MKRLAWLSVVGLTGCLQLTGLGTYSFDREEEKGGKGGAAGESTGGAGGMGGATGGQGAQGGTAGTGGIWGQSCNGLHGTECQGQSCCSSTPVPGGTFPMGRCAEKTGPCEDLFLEGSKAEIPEHDVTISDFSLDRFEVTVGRFRRFVDAYPGSKPGPDAGEHPLIPGTGWRTSWDLLLPADKDALMDALKCDDTTQTWTDSPGTNEAMPINCVNWYMAFAFCAWDGARLPTEAEWEYAAAGGDENRFYPWGGEAPSETLANYNNSANSPFIPVGNYPQGVSRWGQYDMAGSMLEWVLDWYDDSWYSKEGKTCYDCANVSIFDSNSNGVLRGGSFSGSASSLRAAYRYGADKPTVAISFFGLRCAPLPPP